MNKKLNKRASSRKTIASFNSADIVELQFNTGWHSRLVRGLYARGPEFDSRISHPCFDLFPFRVAK